MARSRRTLNLAIDLGRDVVRAVRLRRGSIVQVTATLVERRPESVLPDDPTAFGRWLGNALSTSGVGTGIAMFSLDRNAVSIKRFELPTEDPAELPQMVRIAFERELPIDGGDAIIDFTLLGMEDGTSIVQAVAVPRVEVERIEAIALAAGVRVGAITVRCLGAAAIVEQTFGGDEGVLVVDVTGDGLEIALARYGELLFSRGVEIAGPIDGTPGIEQLTVETRRSWLSYRVSSGKGHAPIAVVLGGEEPDRLADDIAAATGLETGVFTGDVRFHARSEMSGLWPLVGLLCDDGEPIDLASPRKAPDRAAHMRQKVLAVLGVVVIAAGIGWSVGSKQLASIEAKGLDLQSKANGTLQEQLRSKRDTFLAAHLRAWREVRPDWLEHLRAVSGPGSELDSVVLNEFTGAILADPTMIDSKGEWLTPASIRLSIEGVADSRPTAFLLRDRFVADPRYSLRTSGADQAGGSPDEFPFRFSLRSEFMDPDSAEDNAE